MDISTIEITSKQVRGNNMDFSTIEIISKQVCGNSVDFSTIEIASKKVRGNYVDFSTSETTSEKYVETTWIFRPSKLHQKSTWKRRGFFDQRNYIGKVRGNDVKFDEIWFLPYRRNIQVDSTWSTHWV